MECGRFLGFHEKFQRWVSQQEEDLEDLRQTMNRNENEESKLRSITARIIEHYREYIELRAGYTKHDPLCFFSPPWCTSFENSFMWIAGCRPSTAIRLVYTICGKEIQLQLWDFLEGERKGNLGELTADQLVQIDQLHGKIVKEEEKLTSQLASWQEEVADHPLAVLAMDGGSESDVDGAFDAHGLAVSTILEEADKLRLSSLIELTEILSPLQAVELLLVAKKIHLRLREWSQRREGVSSSSYAHR